MTEELKQKAEEYITKNCDRWEADCLTVDEIVKSSFVEFATEATKELQEEIAKLKKDNNILFNATEKVGKRNNELQKQIEELEKQLIKAKEIIKKYLVIGVGGKITQNYLDVTKEAEQFLKLQIDMKKF